MKTSYLYEFQKERYLQAYNRNLQEKTELREISVENAYLLPVKKNKNYLFGLGGVFNKDQEIVKESEIISRAGVATYSFSVNDDIEIYMGEGYDFSEEEIILKNEEVVYLGFIRNHWGHFLIDCSTRLWITQKYGKTKKYVFLVEKDQDFEMIENIKRFLELYQVPIEKIEFVNEIRNYKNVIIPEASYVSNYYYSLEYLKMFDTIANNVELSDFSPFDKVYFTRTSFRKANNSEIGEELLINLFKNNGFKIVSPENCSLDKQIALIRLSKVVAGITGTITHNMMFSDKGQSLILLNKTYHLNMVQMDVNLLKDLKVDYVDAYISQFPVSLGWGPFVFVYNKNLKSFIFDRRLIDIDDSFKNKSYLKRNLQNYQAIFRKRNLLKQKGKMRFESDLSSIHYFNPSFLKDYYENYYTLAFPILFRERLSSVMDSIRIKYSNIIDNLRGIKR